MYNHQPVMERVTPLTKKRLSLAVQGIDQLFSKMEAELVDFFTQPVS